MALSTLLSASTAKPGLTDDDIAAIVATAREENARLDVTGLLAFDGKGFAQILEGDGDTIKRLFETIEDDERHTGCVLLSFFGIEKRRFADWSMGYRPLSDLILIQDVIV